MAYVGTDEFGFRAKRAQLANEGLTCIAMAIGDDDKVALLRKSKRRRSPDSSQRAGINTTGVLTVSAQHEPV
jgi:hypothetical protein